jgi:hypothetical protein
MRSFIPTLLSGALLLAAPTRGDSLQAAFDAATPAGGYDKYVVLETGRTYTGGLWIGGTYNRMTYTFETGGRDVRIVGNGAIIDLAGQEICIAYCENRLDIDDCVIRNGNIRFRGYSGGGAHVVPTGSVRYVTFYQPHDYGVRLFGCGTGILVERNIIVDPIDTGPDFMFLTGLPSDWLPTGASVSLSVNGSALEVFDNWSYLSDPVANADPLRHFALLCDYG